MTVRKVIRDKPATCQNKHRVQVHRTPSHQASHSKQTLAGKKHEVADPAEALLLDQQLMQEPVAQANPPADNQISILRFLCIL